MLVDSRGHFGRVGSMLEKGLPSHPKDEEGCEDETCDHGGPPARPGAGTGGPGFASNTGPPTGRVAAGAEREMYLHGRFAAMAQVIQQLGGLVLVNAAYSQMIEDLRVREVRTQETPGKLNIGRQDVTRHKESSKNQGS